MTVEANANTVNKKTDSRNLANKLVKRREIKLVKKLVKVKRGWMERITFGKERRVRLGF